MSHESDVVPLGQKLRCAIGRAVVDDDDLAVVVAPHAVENAENGLGFVVDRHEDGGTSGTGPVPLSLGATRQGARPL